MSEPVFDEDELDFNRLVSLLLLFFATLLVGLSHLYGGPILHWMLPFILAFGGFFLYILVRQSEAEMEVEEQG